MAYSDSEIKAFAERDRRIVRQSSLKVAADLVIAADKEKNDIATLSSVTRGIAQVLTDWVYEVADVGETKDMSSKCPTLGNTPGATLGQLPEPTLAQKKVLDAICKEVKAVGIEQQQKVYAKVLEWAEEMHSSRSYPTKLDSVNKFCKWYI